MTTLLYHHFLTLDQEVCNWHAKILHCPYDDVFMTDRTDVDVSLIYIHKISSLVLIRGFAEFRNKTSLAKFLFFANRYVVEGMLMSV